MGKRFKPERHTRSWARSQQHCIVTERHPKFANGSIEIDPELVSEFQNLPLTDVDHHDRIAWMFSQNSLQSLNLQLIESR